MTLGVHGGPRTTRDLEGARALGSSAPGRRAGRGRAQGARDRRGGFGDRRELALALDRRGLGDRFAREGRRVQARADAVVLASGAVRGAPALRQVVPGIGRRAHGEGREQQQGRECAAGPEQRAHESQDGLSLRWRAVRGQAGVSRRLDPSPDRGIGSLGGAACQRAVMNAGRAGRALQALDELARAGVHLHPVALFDIGRHLDLEPGLEDRGLGRVLHRGAADVRRGLLDR